jgi:hypothetical protein
MYTQLLIKIFFLMEEAKLLSNAPRKMGLILQIFIGYIFLFLLNSPTSKYILNKHF